MHAPQLVWLIPVWPSPGTPTHPIYNQPGIWPSPGHPDQGLPGQPPGIWPGQGQPSHPIHYPPGIWPGPGRPDQGLPGRPPGIWGGPPMYPDQGLPGQPPHASQGPGFPTHPITLPNPVPPNHKPEHPIVLPPDAPPAPSQPIALPAGEMVPSATEEIPGTGTVLLLGWFPGGLGWRWVSVSAG